MAEKQSRFDSVNSQIEELEAGDEGLLAVREEASDCAFKEAAIQIDFNAAGTEAQARSAAAQELYGKPYEELTEAEKLDVEFRADGKVTLEAMALALQSLPMIRTMPRLRR